MVFLKSKKTGLLLIGFGLICIAISLYMLQDRPETEGKDKIEPDTITEDSGEEAIQDTSVATATTAIELDHDTPVQEINSDMYEWPHENIWFEGYKEPDMVIYLAQRKELFDEFVAQYEKYEGKDIYGVVGWDEEEQMVYYEPMFSEDIVAIYDKYEKFFREGMVWSIGVDGDGLSFYAMSNSHEILYYYYDENRNEKTDEFLEDNSIVHVAPHWWWQEADDPY